MLFNSLEFLIFFPIVVIVFFAVPKRWKNLWLLAASYYFYMCWNARYALLLLFSTVITYLSGLLSDRVQKSSLSEIRKRNRKKAVVAVSFFLNLFILFYFKYINFALETLDRLFALIHIELHVPFFDSRMNASGPDLCIPTGFLRHRVLRFWPAHANMDAVGFLLRRLFPISCLMNFICRTNI